MLALRLAYRDLRGSIAGFHLLIAGVAFGTAAIGAIGLLSAMILDGVHSGARTSIGGDVSLRLFHHPPAPEHLAAFAEAGTASLMAELRPLAHHAGRSALVELKAVDEAYPLYGDLELEPALTAAEALERRDGVWGAAVAESLLTALGASLGDVVAVGGHRFELRASIVVEPDRAMRAFTLGPRMMVALPAIIGSDLVAPGTQTYWYSRIRLPPGRDAAAWIADFEQTFPDTGFRIVDADEGVPGVERSLALVTSLLTFVAMGILLVGCVGVASAVSAYLDRKRDTIAILKSLGARSPLVLHLYLTQVLAAAAIGAVLGGAAGVSASLAAAPLLPEWLPVEGGFALAPLLIAGGFGLLSALLFSLWPLAKAESLSPQVLFRQIVASSPSRPRGRMLAAMALTAALLAALLVFSTPLPLVAGLFAAAAAVVVLSFLALGRLLGLGARAAGRRLRLSNRPLLRLALGNLHRPGAPTMPLVMAAGLSLTLLVAVAALRENADRHLATTLPVTAPDLVVLNIPPSDAGEFDAAMAESPDVERWERAPFLHARVSRIDDQPLSERRIPADVAFVIRGDRGLSWRAEPPPGGVDEGSWWALDYDGPPLISLDRKVARRLGVTIGDSLTLNVLGAPLRAEIASLRTVDWAGLELDFPILLSPPREPPPHREIAALWTEPGVAAEVRKELARRFPESPTLVVAEAIGFLSTVVEGVGAALTAASAATGLAALLVLGGTVAGSRQRRLREAVVLKVLGATRRQVLMATAIEFTLLGLATGLAALVLGNLAAWASVRDIVDFQPVVAGAMPSAIAVLATMAAVGFAAGWRAWRPPVARVLRRA